MGERKYNIQNLKPITHLSSDVAKKRGAAGGHAKAKAVKERKLISQSLAEYFGEKDLRTHYEKIMNRNDAVSVALLKVATEATEGQKIKNEMTGADGEPLSISVNINATKPTNG